jgi:TonB family protein
VGARSTANDRFKARTTRLRWAAVVLTMAVHAAVFFLTPAFRVAGPGPRMVVVIGEWGSPPQAAVSPGQVAWDSAADVPVPSNLPAVNGRVPRLYPWLLWHHREPSSARVQLALTRSGRVRDVRIMDGTEVGADSALVRLVRMMRFEPPVLPEGGRSLIAQATIQVADRTPERPRPAPGFQISPE